MCSTHLRVRISKFTLKPRQAIYHVCLLKMLFFIIHTVTYIIFTDQTKYCSPFSGVRSPLPALLTAPPPPPPACQPLNTGGMPWMQNTQGNYEIHRGFVSSKGVDYG